MVFLLRSQRSESERNSCFWWDGGHGALLNWWCKEKF